LIYKFIKNNPATPQIEHGNKHVTNKTVLKQRICENALYQRDNFIIGFQSTFAYAEVLFIFHAEESSQHSCCGHR